jgi:hypothetical protein
MCDLIVFLLRMMQDYSKPTPAVYTHVCTQSCVHCNTKYFEPHRGRVNETRGYFSRHYQIAVKIKPLYLIHYTLVI